MYLENDNNNIAMALRPYTYTCDILERSQQGNIVLKSESPVEELLLSDHKMRPTARGKVLSERVIINPRVCVGKSTSGVLAWLLLSYIYT